MLNRKDNDLSAENDSSTPTLRGKYARQRAREVLRPYSAKYVAEAADATEQTAKYWKAGRGLPNFEKSANLSSNIPEWWSFVCESAGMRRQ